MASKPTSDETFLNASLITGRERVRISKRQSTGQRLWENFQIDFTGLLRFVGINITTSKSVTGNGTSGNPIQLVNDETTPAANKFYGTNLSGVRGWFTNASGGGGQTLTGTRAVIITALTAGIDTTFYDKVFITDRNIGLYLDTSSATTNSTTGTGWRMYDISKKALGLIRIDNRDGQPAPNTWTVDSVTVDAIEQLGAPVAWNTDINQTAIDVALAITITGNYNAIAVKNFIVIEQLAVGVNTDVITISSGSGIDVTKISDMQGGAAVSYEEYLVNYDITNDIITWQRDPVRNNTVGVSEKFLIIYSVANPITFFPWGDDRATDITVDSSQLAPIYLVGTTIWNSVTLSYTQLANSTPAYLLLADSIFANSTIRSCVMDTVVLNSSGINSLRPPSNSFFLDVVLDNGSAFGQSEAKAVNSCYLDNSNFQYTSGVGFGNGVFRSQALLQIDGNFTTNNYSARNFVETTIGYDTVIGTITTGDWIINNTTGAIAVIIDDTGTVFTLRSLSLNWNNNDVIVNTTATGSCLQNGSLTKLTTLYSNFSAASTTGFDYTAGAGIYIIPNTCSITEVAPVQVGLLRSFADEFIIKPDTGSTVTFPFAAPLVNIKTPVAFVATNIVLDGSKGDFVRCKVVTDSIYIYEVNNFN